MNPRHQLSCMMSSALLLYLLWNLYAMKRFWNIIDAIWVTRFFTAQNDDDKQQPRRSNPWKQEYQMMGVRQGDQQAAEENQKKKTSDNNNNNKSSLVLLQKQEHPMVTIQICCYNESEVIERTMRAACAVDWPQDRFVVQVLDDSTDASCSALIERVAKDIRTQQGIDCTRLTRPDRTGYKAGNLLHHMTSIRGDFVAMFDSDHECETHFLRRAMPYFFHHEEDENQNQEASSSENDCCPQGGTKRRRRIRLPNTTITSSSPFVQEVVAMVHASWSICNVHQSLLTEYDTMLSDAREVIEQNAHCYRGGGWFNGGGSGAIWRKQALEEAGGWSSTTIIEDFDMCNKIYFGLATTTTTTAAAAAVDKEKEKEKEDPPFDTTKNPMPPPPAPAPRRYVFRFLRHLPQHLQSPPDVPAHVIQKYRWTKGNFQVVRKDFWNILTAVIKHKNNNKTSSAAAPTSIIPWKAKLNVLYHITAPCLAIMGLIQILLFPLLVFQGQITTGILLYSLVPLMESMVAITIACYGMVAPPTGTHYRTVWQRTKRLVCIGPLHWFLWFAMVVFKTVAIWEGLTSDDATFEVTPKVRVPLPMVNNDDKDEKKKMDTGKGKFQDNDDDDDDDDAPVVVAVKNKKEDDSFASSSSSEDQEYEDDEQTSLLAAPTAGDELVTTHDTRITARKRRTHGDVSSTSITAKTRMKNNMNTTFRRDMIMGIMGLMLGIYEVTWFVILLVQQRQLPVKEGTAEYYQHLVTVLFPLVPATGLFYMHGHFLYHKVSNMSRTSSVS